MMSEKSQRLLLAIAEARREVKEAFRPIHRVTAEKRAEGLEREFLAARLEDWKAVLQ